MEVRQQTISAERFFELMEQPEYLDRVIELVAGELIEMSKPTSIHGIVVGLLSAEIVLFVKRGNLGGVMVGDTGFALERKEFGKDSVRGLDIAYVSKERLPNPPDFSWYEIGPDLAVEVISPSNKTSDTHLKVMQLLNAGTRLVWLVHPESRTVVAHTAKGAVTLSGGDVLPGFQLRIGDIFPS